jgi:D-alanyl-lipoteichoic acid acyltransferase DltB (MBOAT superfamily)
VIFNSFTYIVFLTIAVSAYWVLPRTPRLLMLFAASVLFYGFWRFDFVALLLASIFVDYFAALLIDASKDPRRRKLVLGISIAMNLGLLGFFKYFYFFADAGIGIASLLGIELDRPAWNIILPIGISFYTFHSMSYMIDVYRGFIKPIREFVLYWNYVVFFPQLIAGPILRAGEVIWQLDKRPAFDPANIPAGLQRIVAGLFLKVVLADNLAGLVDEGFAADPGLLSAIDVITLGFMFGFQIYLDFSAYSHIAIGSARLMGIRFPENFHYPYLSTSPREFWKRWHISLSSWIRDYLYLPLTGAKVQDRSVDGLTVAAGGAGAGLAASLSLFLTWAIMGLWHGAAWAFALWGVWHAAMITLYRLTRPWTARLPAAVQRYGGWAWTLPVMMLGWIPFRTQSLEATLTLWGHLLRPSEWFHLGLRENIYLAAAVVLVLVVAAPLGERLWRWLDARPGMPALGLRTAGLAAVIAMDLIYLRPANQFIYFQF